LGNKGSKNLFILWGEIACYVTGERRIAPTFGSTGWTGFKTVVFPGAESCPEKEAGRREEYFEAVAILFS
jgi:hypothetical protein